MSRHKIHVSISNVNTQCDHCGTKMSNGFYLKYKYDVLYIGRMCLEKVVDVPTSGNPYRAAKRVELSLNADDPEGAWDHIVNFDA